MLRNEMLRPRSMAAVRCGNWAAWACVCVLCGYVRACVRFVTCRADVLCGYVRACVRFVTCRADVGRAQSEGGRRGRAVCVARWDISLRNSRARSCAPCRFAVPAHDATPIEFMDEVRRCRSWRSRVCTGRRTRRSRAECGHDARKGGARNRQHWCAFARWSGGGVFVTLRASQGELPHRRT